ncbi:MAG: hypothetical protein RLZZ316_2005 [Bacteroidota bacterium]|jgi:hypothetical protein
MTTLLSVTLFFVFLFLSLLHMYWGLGGRWGSAAVIPVKENGTAHFKPGKLPTFIVAMALLAIGVYYLITVKLIPIRLPAWLQQYGLWLLAGIFLLRAIGDFYYVGFFKKIRHTAFGKNDTLYYSPLCLVISLLTALIALFH